MRDIAAYGDGFRLSDRLEHAAWRVRKRGARSEGEWEQGPNAAMWPEPLGKRHKGTDWIMGLQSRASAFRQKEQHVRKVFVWFPDKTDPGNLISTNADSPWVLS